MGDLRGSEYRGAGKTVREDEKEREMGLKPVLISYIPLSAVILTGGWQLADAPSINGPLMMLTTGPSARLP